ncbi:TnsA-like heteromeric transposase endonuclease subunit [Promicromonospora soli]|uniref:TnsA endonuclease-like protein n=1 Tax=Promicromonospora soli TaxID=2035533 RepID=A0A919KRB5_9MICO|nr:TnsA-like heteromeric transposase endonuclease subunit [Promicromonospora soli]GHH70330.1 hypothetical protein GCM10017772_16760 [Promicromonospora soli]
MSSARPECSSGTPSVNRNDRHSVGSTTKPRSTVLTLPKTTWRIRTLTGGAHEWDWRSGAPQTRDLAPSRRPAADAMSRHAPVRMMSQTTGAFLLLESGLEYELARQLDREPNVVWLVGQPLLLEFKGGPRHTPDLLAEHADGRVVVWDARPVEKRDEKFERVAELTERACESVGWEYALFDSPDTTEQLNLFWLRNYRHAPGWPHLDLRRHLLRRAATPVSIGDVLGSDQGDGHLTAVMWHLLWTGELVIDISQRITPETLVTTSEATRV